MWATDMEWENHQHVGNSQNHRKEESLHGGVIKWDKMRPGERPPGCSQDPTLHSCVSSNIALTA